MKNLSARPLFLVAAILLTAWAAVIAWDQRFGSGPAVIVGDGASPAPWLRLVVCLALALALMSRKVWAALLAAAFAAWFTFLAVAPTMRGGGSIGDDLLSTQPSIAFLERLLIALAFVAAALCVLASRRTSQSADSAHLA